MPCPYEIPASGLPDSYPRRNQRGFQKSCRARAGEMVHTGEELAALPGRLWTFQMLAIRPSGLYILREGSQPGERDVLELNEAQEVWSVGRLWN